MNTKAEIYLLEMKKKRLEKILKAEKNARRKEKFNEFIAFLNEKKPTTKEVIAVINGILLGIVLSLYVLNK